MKIKKELLIQNNKKLGKIIIDVSNVSLDSPSGYGYNTLYIYPTTGLSPEDGAVLREKIEFYSSNSNKIYEYDILPEWKGYNVFIGEIYGSPSITYMYGSAYIDDVLINTFTSSAINIDFFNITSIYSEYKLVITQAYNALCCVPYYSKILLSDLSYRQAQHITQNDKLLAYNEYTSTYTEVPILNIIKVTRYELIKITFTDNTYLELTPDHPVLTNEGWVCYDPINSPYRKDPNITSLNQIKIKQNVLQINNQYKTIENIELIKYPEGITTYSFDTPDPYNTYIAENCVVHNPFCSQ